MLNRPPAEPADDALLQELRERIRRDGPMPVDRFMHACLYDPTHGYARRAYIGESGDFITAPEISQMFGELIGLWCALTWQHMGRPVPLRLVELGPGRGTLMRDMLRVASTVPAFAAALTVHLVEINPALREAQKRALTSSGHDTAVWVERLDELPPGPAIVIANEFLDALPIRQLTYSADGWHERVVALAPDNTLRFAQGWPVAYAPAVAAVRPREGALVELRSGEDELLRALAARAAPLAALFIDYGPAEPAYGDTLQAVRRHGYTDPLTAPGHADLTAHVKFAFLADKVRAAGLAVNGPLTQAEFLGRLGLTERASRLMSTNPDRAGEIEAAAQRLMSPSGMGSLFKAMAVLSPGLSPLAPFS